MQNGLVYSNNRLRVRPETYIVLDPNHRWFEGFNWEGLRKGTLTPPIIPEVSFLYDE